MPHTTHALFDSHSGTSCSAGGRGGQPCPSSLEAQETSAHDDLPSSYRAFLVSGCKARMEKAERLYRRLDALDNGRRLENLLSCRSSAYVMRHRETHLLRIASRTCGLRWCPLCARSKRTLVAVAVKDWIESQRRVRFMTLTLRNSQGLLSDQIDRLYRSFRNLRRWQRFKECVRGGIWFTQVTYNNEDQTWHPHLHIVYVGRYLPQDELSDMWLTITGDSYIVDVRDVKSSTDMADYVSRYVSEPAKVSDLDDDTLLQLALALHGRRICGTWGPGRDCRLSPQTPADSEEWEQVGSWWAIVEAAYLGGPAAELLRCWREGLPYDGPLEGVEIGPPGYLADKTIEHPTFLQAWLKWGSDGNDN